MQIKQTQQTTANQEIVKASFNLHQDDIALLKRLAARQGCSLTYALRQALVDSEGVLDLENQGQLVLHGRGGRRTDISFRD